MRRYRPWRALAAALLAAGSMALPAHAEQDSAVVLAYSRFGDDRQPALSIRLDQFEAHIREIQAGARPVLPLPKLLAALEGGKPLPERAIVITIDDASRSALDLAVPRLRAAGLPFTVFVAPDLVDRGAPTHAAWSELRALRDAGATFGLLAAPLSAAELARGVRRLRDELGRPPEALSYVGGAISPGQRALVAGQGFRAAFTQASGAVHGRADPLALPRFFMNESYGSLERFLLVAEALPLPVSDVTPADPVLGPNPPAVGFTVSEELGDLEQLSCFASNQGRVGVERLGGGRVEVQLTEPFPPGRGRVNCTLPAGDGHWRWFGLQLVVPGSAGSSE
ncbi:polysaccharide deacetylase family protein [Arenibaculum pallidiluteum]|uniref:polysaccharide deacetylase family protein n=1 Tax=Arenibaculum pallidiluteum TaxID=2812559 RepID=UPI001A96F49E|nr:polysaccharide deacetylase family protein [Arenibaculum pallidiluteum]